MVLGMIAYQVVRLSYKPYLNPTRYVVCLKGSSEEDQPLCICRPENRSTYPKTGSTTIPLFPIHIFFLMLFSHGAPTVPITKLEDAFTAAHLH